MTEFSHDERRLGRPTRFQIGARGETQDLVKVSQATETSGPIGAVIDVDRARLADGVLVLGLSGDLDVFSVPRLRSVLREHIGVVDIVMDLSAVDFCDSSMLRVLVDTQRRSAAAGRRLEIARPSTPVRELFDVSGLRGVLHVTSEG